MNILYVAQWAGAEKYGMVYGHYYLAREWVRQGHQVTVMAAAYSHTRFAQPNANKFSHAEEYIDGIRYVWVPVNHYSSTAKLGRIFSMSLFSLRAFFHRSKVSYDAVISSSHHPFSIFASRFLAWRNRARLVFEVRDLWPASLIHLAGVSEKNPFIRLMAWAEHYAYRHADLVVTTLENGFSYMAEKGLDHKRFCYIPNGAPVMERAESPLPPQLAEFKSSSRFTIVYCGNVGLANNLQSLVAAGHLLDADKYEIIIVGDGPEFESLKSSSSGGCVIFCPRIEKAQVASLLVLADLVYISYLYSPLYEYGISPTKINDYAEAEKPILFAADFHLGEIEEESFLFRCGDSAFEVASEIVRLSQLDEKELSQCAREGRTWVRSKRDYGMLAERYVDAMRR